MAFKKKAGNSKAVQDSAAANESVEAEEFIPREIILIDDKMDGNGVVVRKIEQTISRELIDGDLVETVEKARYVHGLYTVNCPRDPDPKGLKRVVVSIDGTHPDGSAFHYDASIQRGVNVPNVPYCALEALESAIETRYRTEERADKQGNELIGETGPAYPFTPVEGPYWTRK